MNSGAKYCHVEKGLGGEGTTDSKSAVVLRPGPHRRTLLEVGRQMGQKVSLESFIRSGMSICWLLNKSKGGKYVCIDVLHYE